MQHSTRKTNMSAGRFTASILLLAALFLAACRPVAPAASEGGGAVNMPNPAEDWSRIEAEGKMVVGTSADYAPFEAYNEQFQIDGFDAALMRALGEALGVEVVFQDFAFDGLGGALALGQVDAAIAAITVTPERAAQVDFTRPYFASSEGLLVRAGDERAPLDAAEALAGLRIGVEQGTVYESAVRTLLVDGGTVAEEDLIVYTSIDKAVADLAEERIDVVITDLLAAEALAASGDYAVASQGVFEQVYAVAVRQGSDELRARLDAALAGLQADGTLARLAEAYLGLTADQLTPPGDLPAAGAAAAGALDRCIDGAAFVEDLSLPDLAMTAPAVMAPAQPLTKAWRVRNSGTCTWHDGYKLDFAYGNAPGAGMGGQAVAVQGDVAPGATYEIAVDLVAPIVAGAYQGVWQFQNSAGRGFGESLRVGIQVAGAPTPTPQPTQTPAPGITFFANKEIVRQGEPVKLLWEVEGAQEVYFYQRGQDYRDKAVEARGEADDIPGATTTYELRVLFADDREETRTLTVVVEPAPELPQITHFGVTPSHQIAQGQCVTIEWLVEGDVEDVAIFRNKEAIWEAAPVEGAYEDCPQAPGAYDYAVGARGTGGANYDVATVTVKAGKAAAQAPEAAGPVIDVFAVQPAEVAVNGCVQLNWRVGGAIETIRVLRNRVVLLDDAPKTGSGADCLTEAGAYRYRLEAIDEAGQRAEAEVEVTVTAMVATPIPSPAAVATALPAAGSGASAIAGKTLVAISFRDVSGALISPLPGTEITAVFADGALSGAGGCNQYHAGYQVGDDGSITLSPIASTPMFCEEPIGVMDQEAHYLSAIQTAAQLQTEEGLVTLLDGAGRPVAVFVSQ